MAQVEHPEVRALTQRGWQRLQIRVVRQSELLQRDALADVLTDFLDLVVGQRQLVQLGHSGELLSDGFHAVRRQHDGVEPRHPGERLHRLDAIFVGDERAEVGHAVDSLERLELVAADVEDTHVRHATRLTSHGLTTLLLVLPAVPLVGALVLAAAAADLPRLSLRARREPRASEAAVGQAQPLKLLAFGDGGDGRSVRDDVIAKVQLAEVRAPPRERRVDARHPLPLQVERDAAAVLERERGVEDRHVVWITAAPADT